MGAATSDDALIVQAYATALFGAGKGKGVVAQLVEQAKALEEVLGKQPTFRIFLEGPQIPTEDKRAVVDRVFKERFDPILMNLLYMMIDRERTILLAGALAEFREIAERAEGIFSARLTSARELDSQLKERLQRALEKFTKCKLRIRYYIEPKLLGGVVFRFSDVQIDASIRQGLNEIRKRFIGDPRAAA